MQQEVEDRRGRAHAAAVGGRTGGDHGRQNWGRLTSQEAGSRQNSQWCIWRWVVEGGDYGNGERWDRVEGRWSWATEKAVIRKLWIVHLNFSRTVLRWLLGDGDQPCRPSHNTVKVGSTGKCLMCERTCACTISTLLCVCVGGVSLREYVHKES